MRPDTPAAILLADYQPPRFLVDTISLTINLQENDARVTTVSGFRINPEGDGHGELVLAGINLNLADISINGQTIGPSSYQITAETLTIAATALPADHLLRR